VESSNNPGTSSPVPRLGAGFYLRDVLEVAPDLLGKVLARRLGDGTVIRARITEVEAYRGTEDLACHASRGKTERTKVMFGPGGSVYVYLIYGMYWMLNFVTGPEGIPQAVLLRGVDSVGGPGRLARYFGIDHDFYAEDLCISDRLWVEDHPGIVEIAESPRIGVGYAGEYWASRPWRYTAYLSSREGVKKT
jgi:DNA-3-methyladenine glycosylase